MKYLSLFSGIGAPERALQEIYEERNGNNNRIRPTAEQFAEKESLSERWDSPLSNIRNGNGGRTNPICIGYSEIDKYAIQIYEKHFPEHTNFGDITKINAEELPDFDLIIGGFPCQAFSIAGKRKGFEDTRGTLFFDIARILRAKRPRLLLLENVKGLLSHDNGNTFRTIISTLNELGYDLQWQVLNSKNFGVPQNRERVFIIGHLRGTPRPKVFPFGETNGTTNERLEPTDTKSEVAQTIRQRYGNGTGSHIAFNRFPILDGEREISRTILARDYKDPKIVQLNNPTHSNNRIYGDDGISPSLNTMQGGNRQPKVKVEEMKIRRLTPTECARLQGFPDKWHEGLSDTQAYKVYGNSMTVNVMKAILEKLLN